jgi:L-alanine-DL-glutamate epimerase-like enolase superfamily enzyme
MKITAVETIQVPDYYNLIWVRLHTDEGLIGLGECFRNADSVATFVHETLGPYLVGKDPLRLPELMADIRTRLDNRFIGFPTRSIEVRAVSGQSDGAARASIAGRPRA